MITEFKRVKHGEQPGDISRRHKIRMREKGGDFNINYGGSYFHHINEKCVKQFRLYLSNKSRKVQRRRDKRACGDIT